MNAKQPNDYTTEIHKALHRRRCPFLCPDNFGCKTLPPRTKTFENSESYLGNETSHQIWDYFAAEMACVQRVADFVPHTR